MPPPDTRADRARSMPTRRRGRRRLHLRVRPLLLLAGVALLANAVVGERSLLQRVRAERDSRALATTISALRRENLKLREQARRLREDPAAIETLARGELGLIRTGEVLVVVRGKFPSP